MHRLAPLLSALALAGCATSPPPTALLERGERYEFASATTPRRLAICTATNARIFSSEFTSEVEELVRPDNFQVVVRRMRQWQWRYDPIVAGRASPVPGGSQIVLYVSTELGSTERADWIERMRKGCEIDFRTAIIIPAVPRDALPAENPPPPPAPASPPPAGRQPRG